MADALISSRWAQLGLALLIGASIGSAIAWLLSPAYRWVVVFDRYQLWWNATLMHCRLDRRFRLIPRGQAWGALICASVSFVLAQPVVLVIALLVVGLPPWVLGRYRVTYEQALGDGLDTFLSTLADSLATIPNLQEALFSVLEHVEPPIKGEVEAVLGEVQLGRSLDDALNRMAGRLKLPGLDAAITAALLGKRAGGDLATILRNIGSALRELNRLEGVIKSKTAEGRTQAWVMGSAPVALIGLLEWINPEWLAPLFGDPLGWLMLGGAAVLEVVAIALIRKIVAVEI